MIVSLFSVNSNKNVFSLIFLYVEPLSKRIKAQDKPSSEIATGFNVKEHNYIYLG